MLTAQLTKVLKDASALVTKVLKDASALVTKVTGVCLPH